MLPIEFWLIWCLPFLVRSFYEDPIASEAFKFYLPIVS